MGTANFYAGKINSPKAKNKFMTAETPAVVNKETNSIDTSISNTTTKDTSNSSSNTFRSNIATQLIDKFSFVFTNGQLWAYNEKFGHFEVLTEQALNYRIEQCIKDHMKNSSALTKEISSEIYRRCYCETYSFNSNHFKINFQNRVYDAASHSVEKHNIKYQFNYTLNAELSTNNANWKNTQFFSFIETLCGYDKDKIKRLQEACGILISDIPFKGGIFFIGEHDTGKSTLARILKYLVGDKYISSVSLDKMDKNFALSQMRNARLNIAGEIANGIKPQQFKIFKELTGGDSTYIDVKFEQPFSTVITAKHLFSGNFLPELPIEDDSLIDRINVIYFNNTIPRDKRDVNLTEKLLKEIDEIAMWCVKGLRRYINNGYKFTEDADSTNYYTRHLKQCNSSKAFIDQYISSGEKEDFIVNTELFDLYCCFCSDNDLPVLSKQQLSKK